MTKNKKPEVQSTDKSQKCIMQNKFVLASFLIAMLGSLIHNIYPQATSTVAFQLLTLFSLKNYPLFNNFFNTKIQLNNNLHQIIESMVKTADQPLQKYKVAVGYGSCADIFTDALPLFKKVGIKSPESVVHHSSIDSGEELAQVFTYFFQEGAAAERYISDIELFDKLVDNVPKNDKYALGGNAPVMANRLAKEQKDSEILLAAQHSHEFKDWMDSRVKFTGPETSVADRHLILEYKTGDKFDDFLSPRANRFIVHSDAHNPDIRGLDANFGAAFDEMDPNLLVISGLQMMDNFPYQNGKQSKLIDDMANFCKDHRSVKTHFELASFVDTELVQEIIQKLMPYVDSVGCNEQELPNIFSALSTGKLITIADSMPKVANILDMLRKTFDLLQNVESDRKPSRIHVHTLAYQAIIQRDDPETEKRWPNIEQAAAKASVTAIRHICQKDEVVSENAKILLDNSFRRSVDDGAERQFIDPENPVTCWKEPGVKICLAVGLVCTNVAQTAGGGDNISAAALAAQLP